MAADQIKEHRLSVTFRKWLLVVVIIVFVLFAQLGWSVITTSMTYEAENQLQQQMTSLEAQATSFVNLQNEMQKNGIDRNTATAIAQRSIAETLNSYSVWAGGIVVFAVDNKVVASNFNELIGLTMSEAIGSAQSDDLRILLDGETLEERKIPGFDGIYYAKTGTGSFTVENRTIEYEVMVALPRSEVFAYRLPLMGWLAVSLLVLLSVLTLVVMRLLNRTVLKNISATNDALAEISAGNLGREVDRTDVKEFNMLSDGINATVDSLKFSMSEIQGRIDRELATAKAIQESALPSTFPPFPEIDAFDLYASMNPAREVGGDFYDFFLLEKNKLGLVMADVSGKGIPAALFMMAAKTEIRACMESGMGLLESIRTANWQLCQGNEAGMFVTVFAAILDYETGVMEYVNAGHNPPLIRHEGKWEWLREKSGLFLGAYPKLKFKQYEVTLSKDDELLLYTDGVTEAWDPNEEIYGEDRLQEFLNTHNNLHSHALVNTINRELERWENGAEQADDITLLVLEYGVPPISTETLEVPAHVEELDTVVDFINAECSRRLCPMSVQNKVDICLEELFVNVARYAYGDDQGKAWITYTYLTEPTGIRVEIADEGTPFNPLEADDPERFDTIEETPVGGLGIFMTKTMSDDIEYTWQDGRNITRFELRW